MFVSEANERHRIRSFFTTSIPFLLTSAIDGFVPLAMRPESDSLRRARMFLLSHMFGPWLGLTITLYLYTLDPSPGAPLWILLAAIGAFWIFPVALKLIGAFIPLALVSVQNLAFIVLFGSYHYGGVSSPFLPWLLAVPLLAFFYLGESPRLRLLVLVVLALDIALFYGFYELGESFPERVPLAALSRVGILSIFCAALYVTTMALYHARILSSRSELEREIQLHKVTMIQLRASAEAAAAANRAKSEFLATMSHELRTPLNAIIGFSEIMTGEVFGPLENPRYRGYSSDIHSSGTHLLEIINDILDLAKAEAGRLVLTDELIDLPALVDAACRLIRQRAETAGLTLSATLSPGLPRLRGDGRKLKQVLLNLLSNAAKFTPSGGQIDVRVTGGPGTDLVIVVADTGIGIAAEDLSKVFQPFLQIDSTLSRRHEGTGLGLSLVAAIMEQHGGRVVLESDVGKGTVARLQFPPDRIVQMSEADKAGLGDRDASPVPSEGDGTARSAIIDGRPAMPVATDKHSKPGAPSPSLRCVGEARTSSGRKTILVVDDAQMQRDVLRRMLERAGFDVVLSVNGRDGLARFRQSKFDAVVTDIMMPEMDGIELTRALVSESPNVKIVVLSGMEDRINLFKMALQLGAKAALQKPVTPRELVDAVRQVLEMEEIIMHPSGAGGGHATVARDL